VIDGSLTFPVSVDRVHNPGMQVRDMRRGRGWSQEQLAEASGLSVRTIQRIESGQPAGLASAAALARAFEVEVDEVMVSDVPEAGTLSFLDAIRVCLVRYAEFEGRAGRAEYWWFVLFVTLATSAAALASEAVGGIVLLLLLTPLAAAGARRLHDVGYSGWWQLFALAPVGVVVPLVLQALPEGSRRS
jgi:transcriptional regulator with XRE-family HTH domain